MYLRQGSLAGSRSQHLPIALAGFGHAAAQHEARRVDQVGGVPDRHPDGVGTAFKQLLG
jgi:hypothetical protein